MLTTNEGTQVFRFSAARPASGLTWADIMADRVARGLEVACTAAPTPPPPAPKAKTTRAPKAKAPKAPEVWGTPADPRLPSNVKPCTAPASGQVAKTAAQAAKSRRVAMAACLCRLCALALRPPMTFAEQARYVGTICDETQERTIFGAPRVLREHTASREAREALAASLATPDTRAGDRLGAGYVVTASTSDGPVFFCEHSTTYPAGRCSTITAARVFASREEAIEAAHVFHGRVIGAP